MVLVLTLGINSAWHDSSAALVGDGEVLFAAMEERYSRVKHDSSFPTLAIRNALKQTGVSFSDIDDVAFGWNRPGSSEAYIAGCIASNRIPFEMRNLAGHVALAGRAMYTQDGKRALIREYGEQGNAAKRARFVDHHLAHAWSAFGLSGFDDAAVLVVDGHGAWQATSIYAGRGGDLHRHKWFAYPNSLGSFYTAFTDLFGFESNADEWKLMGLAAYGEPTVDLSDILAVRPDGYQVNTDALRVSSRGPRFLQGRFGPRRDPERGFSRADKDLASSVQEATGEAMLQLVRMAVEITGSRRLCLAGGVAMNSKANGQILASGLVDELFVQPAATDDGTAIGAAIATQRRRGAWRGNPRMTHAYLGTGHSDAEIHRVLEDSRVPYLESGRSPEVAAQLLADGYVVGWFQGRMEFGPRALGSRSILADPRDPRTRDRVNASVKFREEWRPFAPACLAERSSEYFEPASESPFMILTFTVRADKRSIIPAVTHVDNSARVQTVDRQTNPRYWEVISAFDRLTGVPVVMNTSFNLRGEPIVCTPQDALRTFFTSGLDFLCMGDAIVAKSDVADVLDRVVARRDDYATQDAS